MIFEKRIGNDVEGKVRATIFRHLDVRRETTKHNSPHNFLRPGIRNWDHANSKCEHKGNAYLTYIALFIDEIMVI
jgi:hypothetical protein